MKNQNPTVRINLWLEKEDIVVFGHGRVQLLEKIDELGSLRKAAEDLGMSYRGAWGKIKATEEIIGKSLIEKVSNREGYRLTELGKELLNLYEKWHRMVEKYALKKAEDIFPFHSHPREGGEV